MDSNSGISATGGSNVSGNAVASGRGSKAEVRVDGPLRSAAEQRTSPQEISALLARMTGELARSGHPERAELVTEIEAARDELAAPSPRTGRLRRFAAGLSSAMEDFAPLAALAATIEQAIRGL
ncbi:hypothetical protein [Actinacidiphila acididurans]|uniref:Uncharacterized protein n=1 Tax=Actinacidiphila acididurans TaxID=2784346 RepID=A0ABS2TRB5_9ACTN|nr:hypothetical protein [Actinacidiphila acididurans]MBM9505870.1 hypothetical protein [Actinacidiphila acididurans]